MHFFAEISAFVDPLAQKFDFFLRQGTGWRHLHGPVAVHDAAD